MKITSILAATMLVLAPGAAFSGESEKTTQELGVPPSETLPAFGNLPPDVTNVLAPAIGAAALLGGGAAALASGGGNNGPVGTTSTTSTTGTN